MHHRRLCAPRSEVLNRAGQAVALNAAAKEGTMHAFYLPLHRISRALRAVQAGEAVSRGTLCAAFQYTSFPEALGPRNGRDWLRIMRKW